MDPQTHDEDGYYAAGEIDAAFEASQPIGDLLKCLAMEGLLRTFGGPTGE
ncbi:MAG: hypothetical protein QM774_06740 [Gordonia sp. (in: high G+C Gram-positive bacteria)]